MKKSFAFALLLSLGLHGLGFGAFFNPEDISAQGSGPIAEASLGNSFADMVSGVAQPVTPDTTDGVLSKDALQVDTAEPSPPAEAASTPVADISETAPSPRPKATNPSSTPRATMGPAIASETELVRPSPVPPSRIAALAPTTAQPERIAPNRTETSEVETTRETAPQAQPSETEPTETATQITGQAPIVVQQADASTERPRARPDRRQRPAQQGSSDQDATRGANSGTQDAASSNASSSNQGASQQGDSAAATNYPGRVWSKLQRGRRSGAAGRGTAVVTFRIASNGALVSVAIARSSGNARLDRAALRHVRRTAPFPAPPVGAKTSFNFSYVVE